MVFPVQITAQQTAVTDATRALIEASASKLEQFYDRVTGCRVVVEVPAHFRSGRPRGYRLRIDLTVPGGEVVVRRKARPGLRSAVQDAFDAAGRRLQDYARRQRGDVKRRAAPQRGVVTQLFAHEGYGFLRADDSHQVYFHRRSVLEDRFDALEVGSAVRFAEEGGDEGPQASTVALARR